MSVTPMPLPEQENSGIEYTETGLRFNSDIQYTEWDDIGVGLATQNERCPWWIGDWMLYGEEHFGELTGQARAVSVADEAQRQGWQLEPDTVLRYTRTAKKFKDRTLCQGKIRFYIEVINLADQEARDLLQKADSNGWPVSRLKQEIKKLRGEPAKQPAKTRLYRDSLTELISEIEAWVSDGSLPAEVAQGSEVLQKAKTLIHGDS